MTKPHSGGADAKSDQPEGESAAVRVQTDAASEPDTAEVQTTEPVEGEANEPEDAENTVGAEDTEQAEAAISDEADAEGEAQEGKPAKAAISDEADAEDEAQEGKPAKAKLRISWPRVLAYGLLPGLALVLAAAGGFLKWQDSSARAAQLARIESVAAAKDSTIALLSYKSDTVEKDLEAAKNRMTGAFKESYSQLINDVVIPGAKKGHISTTASVPAAASVSATANHAVTLLFVNQTAVVDKDPPTDTVSSVRVTLDKVAGRWLISGFDPV
jgi:Mce-associated membrane protein